MNVAISHEMWGAYPAVRLSSEMVELLTVAEVGARVVSLRDLHRDREWLLGGEPPSEAEATRWSSEDVVFSGRESFGWDECLPSVAVCVDPLDADSPPLRDHGDQWGRAAYLAVDHAAGAVEHTWVAPRWSYRLTRRLSFGDQRTVLASYQLMSLAERPLPILWSQHPVFHLEPGTRLELPGVATAWRTSQLGIELPEETSWPSVRTVHGRWLDLSTVHTALGWAAKLYAQAREPVTAVAQGGARLTIDWDREFAPLLGIWLSYGGWPADSQPREQVALEPTTSAHDDLASAQTAGQERILGPGEERSWWVSMTLS